MSRSKKSQVKSELTQSAQLSKNTRTQVGTKPEVTRNCKDSTSKHCHPSVSTNHMCPDSRNLKMQSNHKQLVKVYIV